MEKKETNAALREAAPQILGGATGSTEGRSAAAAAVRAGYGIVGAWHEARSDGG